MSKKDGTFTAGELAEMFQIPKQTLLYYDKIGAIKPQYISENGYRHYSMMHYMILEIIINLRKMDIPMNDICSFLKHRSCDELEKILNQKNQECDDIIAKAEQIKSNISTVKRQIDKVNQTVLGQFTLSFRPEKQFFITPVKIEENGSDGFKLFIEHNKKIFSKEVFKEKAVGWIVPADEFFNNSSPRYTAYFSTIKNDTPVYSIENERLHIRPAGLYVTVRFKGLYIKNVDSIAAKFKSFLKQNHLKAIGSAYVMPLKNHWMTDNTDEYINQISIQVKKIAVCQK